MSGGLSVRAEAPADFEAIDAIHTQAFGQPGEAALVRALRREAQPYLGLVAEQPGEGGHARRVVGHIAFSPVRIEGGSPPALGLGPLAVEPAQQRRGVGVALMHAGLARCAALAKIVVVLGHASYYPRFGFRPASPLGLRYRSEVFDPSFFVLKLEPGALERHQRLGALSRSLRAVVAMAIQFWFEFASTYSYPAASGIEAAAARARASPSSGSPSCWDRCSRARVGTIRRSTCIR